MNPSSLFGNRKPKSCPHFGSLDGGSSVCFYPGRDVSRCSSPCRTLRRGRASCSVRGWRSFSSCRCCCREPLEVRQRFYYLEWIHFHIFSLNNSQNELQQIVRWMHRFSYRSAVLIGLPSDLISDPFIVVLIHKLSVLPVLSVLVHFFIQELPSILKYIINSFFVSFFYTLEITNTIRN